MMKNSNSANKLLLQLFTYLVVFIGSVNNHSHAQSQLPTSWKFIQGDNAEYAKQEFDDSQWQNLTINQTWENQGYANYDGYAWYRIQVKVPKSFKKSAEDFGGLLLNLGKIDDADICFFNGTEIGRTGKFPPDFSTSWDAPRRYIIPFKLIDWSKPNTIAVRVYDQSGNGGIYGDYFSLEINGLADLLQISEKISGESNIVEDNSKNKIELSVNNSSKLKMQGHLKISVQSCFFKEVFQTEQELVLSSKSENKTSFSTETLAPGFYKATVIADIGSALKQYEFSFGITPQKQNCENDMPSDFRNYWERARRELNVVAPQFKVKKIDSLCNLKNLTYLVEMRSLENVLIRGWLVTPVKAGKYPAILHVQGYSTNFVPSWVYHADDVVAFGLNIRGHGNSQDNINPGFPGFLQYFVNDKEKFIYRGAYMDCVRAIDFLCSRNEVDTSRIAVEGASQGGALTYATAALDSRIKAAAPDVPFLSDFKHYFQVASWPGGEFVNYVNQHPNISWETIFETLRYVDIKNLALWVKCPVLMQVGLIDPVCPPHINFAAFNNLSVPKEYKVYPKAGHNLPQEAREYKIKWLRKKLGL